MALQSRLGVFLFVRILVLVFIWSLLQSNKVLVAVQMLFDKQNQNF